MKTKLNLITDYEVLNNQVYFYGICSCCKKIIINTKSSRNISTALVIII